MSYPYDVEVALGSEHAVSDNIIPPCIKVSAEEEGDPEAQSEEQGEGDPQE